MVGLAQKLLGQLHQLGLEVDGGLSQLGQSQVHQLRLPAPRMGRALSSTVGSWNRNATRVMLVSAGLREALRYAPNRSAG